MDRRTFIKVLGVLGGLGIGAGSWAQGSRADATAGPEIRPRPQSAWRAAVVGAGVAGLAAARTLAEAGWEVEVLEKEPHPGGFCSTLVIDGFRFDLGPHVFHPMIRPLVGFQPSDLDAATFSESFLLNGKLLSFPRDLLSNGYMLDIMGTLARNAINPERLNSRRVPRIWAPPGPCWRFWKTVRLSRPLNSKLKSEPMVRKGWESSELSWRYNWQEARTW